MAKVLIVDDEVNIRSIIKKYASLEGGYEISEAGNGIDAIELAKKEKFDIIIMDVMMPELDGFTAVKEIRKFSDVPIIMLSARVEEYDRIHGFELGVDDYVVKPFSPGELMCRISAILSRVQQKAIVQANEIYDKGGIKVDFSSRIVYINGERVKLSPKVYELLVYMVKNEGKALMREEIIRDVWGYEYFGADRTLDTHIKMLRKSLGEYARYIVTLTKAGYRFEIA